jgi:hypothetical protein
MKTYKRNRQVAGRLMDERFCLMNPQTNELIVMNETATFIWEQLQVAITLEILENLICEEFDVSKEAANQDLQKFITECVNTGLVEEIH